MKVLAMTFTMVVLAAAPMTAQQAGDDKQTGHPHECPHQQLGSHEMGERHEGTQGMHEVMMMMQHPEMLGLSEAQVQQLATLMERVHEDGMPHMQDPEAMNEVVEEARAILTVEQREQLAELDPPMGEMGEPCPMMQHAEEGAGAGHGHH